MVFDVETREFVGGVCYVVSTLPAEGEVNTFDTYAAEFIASTGSSTPQEKNRPGAEATPSPLLTTPSRPKTAP